MSPGLKPFILPQLVEQRRKWEEAQTPPLEVSVEGSSGVFFIDNTSSSDLTTPVTPATPTFSHRSGLGHLRYSSSSSSLDLALPSPPYSECPASPLAIVDAALASVPPVAHVNSNSSKRPLPDVQEEDSMEREAETERGQEVDDDETVQFPDHPDLYDYCLCDEPCSHGRDSRESRESSRRMGSRSIDCDLGFASDSDRPAEPAWPLRSRRIGTSLSALTGPSEQLPDSSFSGFTQRVGSRIHALSHWRTPSARRSHSILTGAPASEPALSRAPSSRSSSLSAPHSRQPVADQQPPLPLSPSLSFYGSTESIVQAQPTAAAPLDIQQGDMRRSLERDRSMATTPLLPPMFLDRPRPAALPTSAPITTNITAVTNTTTATTTTSTTNVLTHVFVPIANGLGIGAGSVPVSPTTVPEPDSYLTEATTVLDVLPSPPLSSKQSTTSLHHFAPVSQSSAPPSAPTSAVLSTTVSATSTAMSSALSSAMSTTLSSGPTSAMSPVSLEQHDEWSDRLGHANYTIEPRPYRVEAGAGGLDALRLLHAEWSRARINYTKHLVRTGEHYGTTSKTYALTKAKWSETDAEWKAAYHAAIGQIVARADPDECASLSLLQMLHTDTATAASSTILVPRLVAAEGKFPNRGDEDIVGPMVRATSMARDPSQQDDKTKFWKNLANKVGLRK